jgi:hypothetical protein
VGGLAGGGFRAFVKCGGCSFVLLYFMYLFLLFLLPFVWLSFSLVVASLYLPLYSQPGMPYAMAGGF